MRLKLARFFASSIYTNNITKVTLLKGYIICVTRLHCVLVRTRMLYLEPNFVFYGLFSDTT